MAGYVGNLISYHDRREGGLSENGVRRPEQQLMGPVPGCDAGGREAVPIIGCGARHVTGRRDSATWPLNFPDSCTSSPKGRRSITTNHHIRNSSVLNRRVNRVWEELHSNQNLQNYQWSESKRSCA